MPRAPSLNAALTAAATGGNGPPAPQTERRENSKPRSKRPSPHLAPGDSGRRRSSLRAETHPRTPPRSARRHFGTLEGGDYSNQEEADIARGHRRPGPLLKEQSRLRHSGRPAFEPPAERRCPAGLSRPSRPLPEGRSRRGPRGDDPGGGIPRCGRRTHRAQGTGRAHGRRGGRVGGGSPGGGRPSGRRLRGPRRGLDAGRK